MEARDFSRVRLHKTKSQESLDAVDVDCSRLNYISSAGLRVLLIMHKACKGGVSLHGENEVVSEIMSQTGFDSIFVTIQNEAHKDGPLSAAPPVQK